MANKFNLNLNKNERGSLALLTLVWSEGGCEARGGGGLHGVHLLHRLQYMGDVGCERE